METVTLKGDGIDIAADVAGPVDGPPLLFLHGGGQTRQSWSAAVREAARRGYRAWTVDLRGHGDSGWSPDGDYDMPRYIADAHAVLSRIGGRSDRRPALIGASMGGIIGLTISAGPQPPTSALVLVDVTPRMNMAGAREIADFMGSAPGGFASLDEAADAVAAYLPHRPRPSDTSGLMKNLRLREGRYHWHWDPAMIGGTDARTGMDEAIRTRMDENVPLLEDATRALSIPTLLIRGGRSTLVSQEHAQAFLALAPHAEYADIAGAHHMVAGDANDAFADAVFAFLDRQTSVPAGA